jgi:hypothetical protein
VDERNPVIIHNDSATDNWLGEYALLLAQDGGPSIVGIIVCSSTYHSNLDANITGWTDFVNAARASGFANVPDLTASAGAPLVVPTDGEIDSTVPNRSAGGEKIIALSRELGRPARPVVVLAGAQLTDLADAYLVDPTVVDRVVVVSSLGSLSPPRALMTGPNGDLDPWADWIVAQRFKYVQVSAFYDQTADVTASELTSVPQTPFGDWIVAKQPQISALQVAADQVAFLSVTVPQFAAAVQRSSADTSAGFGKPPGQGPPLAPDDSGNVFVVTKIKAPLAASRFWRLLLETPMQGP